MSTLRYLVREGLAQYAGTGGLMSITHDGVREIEAALKKPDEPTQYFPPVNIIKIYGNVSGSTIQQAGANSTQTATISTNDLRSFVEELKSKIDHLHLGESQKAEINADIQTVEAQLVKTTPSQSIIKETLLSVKTILEGIAGNVIASGLLAQLPRLLG